MFSSRLFWRIFAPYALLSLVAAAAFVLIQSNQHKTIVIDQVRQRLHDSAAVLRSQLPLDFDWNEIGRLQDTLVRLGNETGTRMTLVADDGTVVGDSSEDPAQMENHHDRDELMQARYHGSGESQRVSPTLGIPMMYVALRVGPAEAPDGFVRVAMRMSSVNSQVAAVQRLIWGTAIILSLIALVFACAIAIRFTRPITHLINAAEKIAAGDLRQTVDVRPGSEMATLGAAFNTMSSELARRIDQLQYSRTELANNSELLETVLGTMIEGVVVVDRMQHILFANHAACRVLEIDSTAVVGRPLWEAAKHPTIQDVVQEVLDEGTRQQAEFDIAPSNSTVALVATPLPGDPCSGAVLVVHDVTELRRLENLRRDFVSNVSHELKTPLTSIQAYTETLLEGAVDDPDHNRSFLEQIAEQAERLHVLILDLMHLARVESEEGVYEVSAVELRSCVEECVKQHEAVAAAKRIALRINPGPDDLQLIADDHEVRHILANLVDNAIKYTPEGGSVTLSWRADGEMVCIDVSDTGIGIAEKHQERIFERFYRVDKARSRELGGTGLGLAIVKHLTQIFGGRVEITSEVGEGTTFSILLPQAK